MNSAFRHDFVKWVGYFAKIATTKVEVELDSEVMTFEPPKSIAISSLLYRSDNCLITCNKCCYFPKACLWAACESYLKSASPKLITINNKDKLIFTEEFKTCPHIVLGVGCGIHEINPIHCRMPLMKFKQVKDKVYIIKEQYGRNWALGCPIKFGDYNLSAFNEDINRLTRIKKTVDYFEITNSYKHNY